MLTYIILLIFAAICTTFPKKYQNIVGFVLMFIMLILVGLRDLTIGRDTQAYIDKFNSGNIETFAPEYLFVIVLHLITSITDSPQIFILFVTTLIYLPLYIIIRNESINISLALFIFIIATSSYFFETFNLLRQSISIVFLLYVYYYFKQGKYLLMVVFTIISVMFHVSSIILIPFLLMRYVKLSYIKIIILLSISFYIGISKVLFSLFDYLSLFERFANIEFLSRLSVYVRYSDPRTSAATYNLVGILAHIIPLSVTSLLVFQKDQDQTYFNVFFAGVILLNCLIFFKYSERLLSGLTILQIFLIPHALESGSQIRRVLIITFLILLSFVFVYYRIEGITDAIGKPYYKFFFQ